MLFLSPLAQASQFDLPDDLYDFWASDYLGNDIRFEDDIPALHAPQYNFQSYSDIPYGNNDTYGRDNPIMPQSAYVDENTIPNEDLSEIPRQHESSPHPAIAPTEIIVTPNITPSHINNVFFEKHTSIIERLKNFFKDYPNKPLEDFLISKLENNKEISRDHKIVNTKGEEFKITPHRILCLKSMINKNQYATITNFRRMLDIINQKNGENFFFTDIANQLINEGFHNYFNTSDKQKSIKFYRIFINSAYYVWRFFHPDLTIKTRKKKTTNTLTMPVVEGNANTHNPYASKENQWVPKELYIITRNDYTLRESEC